MKIGALKETTTGEQRVALTPESAAQLQKLGHNCLIEKGAGLSAGFSDEKYKAEGVEILTSADALSEASDLIVKVRPPSEHELANLPSKKTLISFFNPGANEALMNLAKSKESLSLRVNKKMVHRLVDMPLYHHLSFQQRNCQSFVRSRLK